MADMIARALALEASAEISESLSHKADLVNGTVPLSQIPPAAIEREFVVENDTARFALTTEEVQLGDTVMVVATNRMYLVIDTDYLDSELGYQVYVAGKATEAVADQNGDTIDTTYVKKVSGKGLSTEDFTTEEKNKLTGIEAEANKTIVDSALDSSSTNPVQNKVIKEVLDNKVDKVSGKELSTNDYTTEEKTKLSELSNYDDTALTSRVYALETTVGDINSILEEAL